MMMRYLIKKSKAVNYQTRVDAGLSR